MTEKLYPRDLNPRDLEPHYGRNVAAMTAEGLDGKAEIAEQLAWRDERIEMLAADVSAAVLLLSRAVLTKGNDLIHLNRAQFDDALTKLAEIGCRRA